MRKARRILVPLVVSSLVLMGAACGDDGEDTPVASGGDSAPAGGVVPEREPEVSGVLTEVEGDGFRLGGASDTYYADMMLVGPDGGEDVVIVDESGASLTVDDLADEQPVDVWVGEACAESFPVQCDIEVLRVDTGT